MRIATTIVSMLVLSLSAPALRAHHSVAASHDTTSLVSLAGIITRVEWRNPHAVVYLEVKAQGGANVVERIEIAGPESLKRRGVPPTTLNVGDQVTFQVWPAKAEPGFKGTAPSGRTVILEDGRRFDVSDNWGAGITIK